MTLFPRPIFFLKELPRPNIMRHTMRHLVNVSMPGESRLLFFAQNIFFNPQRALCSDLQHRREERKKKKCKRRQRIRVVVKKNDSKNRWIGAQLKAASERTSKRPSNNSSCNTAPGDDHICD